MAFTPEQEAKLLQIMDAFEKGVRLDELPHVGSGNPLDYIVEVLDENKETKQAKLAALLPYLEEQCAYGIEWHTNVPGVPTRIGNLNLHRELPIQSRMKGCLLDDEGNVVEYLNPTDWLAHDRTGAKGQVMVELPPHYRKITKESGTRRTALISEYPLPGYKFVPLKYVSAYEASMARSTTTLASVANETAEYRGGNNSQPVWDNTYRSQLGRPATVLSRTALRTAARKRKSGSTEWNIYDLEAHKTIQWLYYIEYANFNSQAAFTAQKDANGYMQGGLGNGATTWNSTAWSATFGGQYYPIVPCGYTDELGNFSGEKLYEIKDENGDLLHNLYVCRYRGIENIFGHIWCVTDGVNIEALTDENGGTTKLYTTNDPALYNDSNYNGYELKGLLPRSEGYIKEILATEDGDTFPEAVGAGSTTYYCDYFWTNAKTSGGLRMVLLSASAHYGANAGLGCVHSHYAPSYTGAHFGSRLCFRPSESGSDS